MLPKLACAITRVPRILPHTDVSSNRLCITLTRLTINATSPQRVKDMGPGPPGTCWIFLAQRDPPHTNALRHKRSLAKSTLSQGLPLHIVCTPQLPLSCLSYLKIPRGVVVTAYEHPLFIQKGFVVALMLDFGQRAVAESRSEQGCLAPLCGSGTLRKRTRIVQLKGWTLQNVTVCGLWRSAFPISTDTAANPLVLSRTTSERLRRALPQQSNMAMMKISS